MPQMTVKTSTIFIAKGNKTEVYHSVGEVPAPLREELERSTNGFQSATILIADRKGRREILERSDEVCCHVKVAKVLLRRSYMGSRGRDEPVAARQCGQSPP